MNRASWTLINAQQGHKAVELAWQYAKPLLIAGHRLVLSVKLETRNSEQNARLHATLADIAAQKEWAGARRELEVWKRLLTAAWLRARGESVEVLPAIDGYGVDVVFRRTSTLSRAECAELITYVTAWAVQNGIELHDYMEDA